MPSRWGTWRAFFTLLLLLSPLHLALSLTAWWSLSLSLCRSRAQTHTHIRDKARFGRCVHVRLHTCRMDADVPANERACTAADNCLAQTVHALLAADTHTRRRAFAALKHSSKRWCWTLATHWQHTFGPFLPAGTRRCPAPLVHREQLSPGPQRQSCLEFLLLHPFKATRVWEEF